MWGIFKIGSDRKTGDIYLTDGFSFYWLFNNPSTVEIHRGVDRLVVKYMLTNASVITSIGDKYTADILSKLLDFEVPVDLPSKFLKPGDSVYIFRLSSIVEKGQVLSKEEVLDLYNRGKIWFDLVRVLK
jgi:hypothetical protein